MRFCLLQVIADLKVKGSRKGVSRSAIKKALGDVSAARVNTSLKKAVAAGRLIQDKESFKLAAAPKVRCSRFANPQPKFQPRGQRSLAPCHRRGRIPRHARPAARSADAGERPRLAPTSLCGPDCLQLPAPRSATP